MTERKILKKKLAKLKQFKSSLTRLIDCSNVNGDNFYNSKDLEDVNKQIEELENILKNENN